MSETDDWRIQGQERYLRGVRLQLQAYAPAREGNDHDHCEFCSAKFMVAGAHGSLADGYSTLDRERWICRQCFEDFVARFSWTIERA